MNTYKFIIYRRLFLIFSNKCFSINRHLAKLTAKCYIYAILNFLILLVFTLFNALNNEKSYTYHHYIHISLNAYLLQEGDNIMASSINVGGTWRQISKVFTNVNGTWKQVQKAYSNINGTWRQWYSGSENKLVRYGIVSSAGSTVNKITNVDVNTLADISSKEYPRTSVAFDICGANSSKIFSITSKPNAQTGALGTIDEIDPDTHVVLRTGKFGDGSTWSKKTNFYINNIDANNQNIIINGYRYTNETDRDTYTTMIWRLDANTMANLGIFSYLPTAREIEEQKGYGALIGNNIYMYYQTTLSYIGVQGADINSYTTSTVTYPYYRASDWGGVPTPANSTGWLSLYSATATNTYTYVMGRERVTGGHSGDTYLTKLSGGNVAIAQRRFINGAWDGRSKIFAMKEE